MTQDNWQFENPGTYLSAGGICSGMSIASLYYYDKKKKELGEPSLYGRYDSGVSGWGLDDEQAIKLCSVIQWWEGNFQSDALDRWHVLGEEKNPVWTYLMFSHSILLTGRPQYVAIYPSDGSAGHAMVVYKKSGNDLYVADPNLPKDKNVKIEFEWDSNDPLDNPSQLGGTFKPFESQWNAGTGKIDFTEIIYIGKSALIDSDFDDLWDKLDNQTLGDRFPDYDLKIIEKDATGTDREFNLTDGYTTTNNVIKVKVETYEFAPRLTGYYAASTIENNETEIVEITLLPGDNNIGFLIEAEMDSDVTNQKEWVWTDFKYITIEREKEDAQTEASISVTNTLDMNVTVLINGEYPGDNASNGYLEPGETLKQVYDPGAYLIEVKTAGVVSNGHILEYTRQISLNPGQAYVYDFETTQDCNLAKLTIVNKSPYRVKLYKNGDYWTNFSLDPNTESSTYLRVGESYSLDAKAPTWEGMCFSDCVYTCWNGPTFSLDCQGYTWTISGSGSTCP